MVKYRRDERWDEKLMRYGRDASGIDLSINYGRVSEGVLVATTKVASFSRDKKPITLAETLIRKYGYIWRGHKIAWCCMWE